MTKSVMIFTAVLLLSANVFSQYKIQGQVVANGAVNAAGNGFRMQGTVGQPVIGLMNSDSVSHSAGFWYQSVEVVTRVEQTEDELVPQSFELEQNYPNPFNPTTVIQFSVPEASEIKIKLYDILGREVTTLVDENYQPGVYKVEFQAADLPSGLYIYRLQTGEFVKSRKMMLLK